MKQSSRERKGGRGGGCSKNKDVCGAATHCNTLLQHTATHQKLLEMCTILYLHTLQTPHTHTCSVLQCVAVCCSVLQCVAVCCSALQCVAVCCSVAFEDVHYYVSTHIMCTWMNMYINIHLYINIHMYMYRYIYMYICILTNIHINIYI